MVRVRFAPSPTGPLHIGGVRTALFNYLFAKQNKGKLILRIEDTDQTRFVSGAEEYICESLKWCGIIFDEGVQQGGEYAPYKQSERRSIYTVYAKKLIDSGNAYLAFDTPDELDVLRKQAESNAEMFVYNYQSRKSLKNSISLEPNELKKLLESKAPYVIRFKNPEERIVNIFDIIRGEISFNTKELDDKVLMKADGLPTYHLANIVDDHLMKITHVIRGEEWLPSLPLHYLLYEAFSWKSPEFAHLPLILKPTGKGKLSKRDGDKMGFPVFPIEWNDDSDESFSSYRESGYYPEAVVNMLALLGWNPGTEQELFSMEELISLFSLEKVGKSGSRFDPDKAKWFNHKYLIAKSDLQLADELEIILEKNSVPYENINLAKVCALMKDRAGFISELYEISSFFFFKPLDYDEKFYKKAWKDNTANLLEGFLNIILKTELLDSLILEKNTKIWLENEQVGIGNLMMPLRLALVGEAKGPHVFDIIEVIGKDETVSRINKLIVFADKHII